MNILIAINSFKESLNSHEITTIIAKHLSTFSSDFHIIQQPLADGGSGFVSVLTRALQGICVRKTVSGPLEHKVRAVYGLCPDRNTAIIELAQAAGLYLMPPRNRNPMRTTTIGVGQLMHAAIRRGADHILLGIGDIATIDCGIGALSVLGARFLDRNGAEIPLNCRGLLRLHSIDLSEMMKDLKSVKITVGADVDNILTGKRGALMYARQKGASARMLPKISQALRRFKRIVYKKTGKDLDTMPGSGAAGGVGGAFRALLGARLVSGFSLVQKAVHLNRLVKRADCVITGEGMIDHKTRCGKATMQVMEMAQQHKKPVILIAGAIEHAHAFKDYGVVGMYTLTARRSRTYAMTHARDMLKDTAQQIGRQLKTLP
jgi:glycerate kinase